MDRMLSSTGPSGGGQRITAFTRSLHRWYSRGTALNFFLARRVRAGGAGVVIVTVIAAGLGLGQKNPPVYLIFSLCVGMALIAIPWALSRRATIRATREMPRYATAGESIRYTISVQNFSKRSLHRAWLVETPKDPRPSATEFALQREPGEHERNAFDRTFAYYRWRWLMDRKKSFTGGDIPKPLDLKPLETAHISAEITPLRRGVLRIDDLRILLPDPFGLMQGCRKVSSTSSILTVLPKRYPLPSIEMAGGSRFRTGDETATNAIGNTGEFVGLRDYRPGDPLRQIHWKSWARTGRPIVKELEDTYYPRYGLVLDTFLSDQNEAFFEEAVSVAASFVAMIDRGESLLDLMFIKDEAHIVTAGRGLARTEKLLEVLSGVEGDREENFADLSRLVLRHKNDLTSCLVVLAGWDEARAAFLQTLTRGGIVCAPLIISSGEKPANLPGHWLDAKTIARDLLALPPRLQTNL